MGDTLIKFNGGQCGMTCAGYTGKRDDLANAFNQMFKPEIQMAELVLPSYLANITSVQSFGAPASVPNEAVNAIGGRQ